MPAQNPEANLSSAELMKKYSGEFDFRMTNPNDLVSIAENSYSLQDIEAIFAELQRRNERERGYHQGTLRALREVKKIREGKYTADGSQRSQPLDVVAIRRDFTGIIAKTFGTSSQNH